ncbi:MAG: phosphate/phosphite/phosphonate ABC transporter substrate-binding protein [Bacteroidetes bacterium]|nr:phosphate/phosphite/phosphonate ABC transporter substrate-binding protein [Bacteroidota bacterium]
MKPYFEKAFGVKRVDFFVATDYAAVIEAMRSNKVDIAQLGELSYILAAERAGAEAIVMTGTSQGQRFTSSVILTGKQSGLKSMDDVKNRAKELSFCFGDPASTSGHLIPRNYLNTINLAPEKSFKSVTFNRDYSAAVLTAVSGKVDLACTFSLALNRLIEKKRLKKEDYIVLWESEPYVSTPIAVRGNLPDDLKKNIRKAYLELAQKEPQLWENYKNKLYIMYPPDLRKQLIYIPSHDSIYNGIRHIARNCEGFKFLDSK